MAKHSSAVHKERGEIQMTQGSLWKNMLFFSIPLMLSQLLQVLFNMADVAVVGKFSKCGSLGSGRFDNDACNAFHGLSHRNGKCYLSTLPRSHVTSARRTKRAQPLPSAHRLVICPCDGASLSWLFASFPHVYAGTARHKGTTL